MYCRSCVLCGDLGYRFGEKYEIFYLRSLQFSLCKKILQTFISLLKIKENLQHFSGNNNSVLWSLYILFVKIKKKLMEWKSFRWSVVIHENVNHICRLKVEIDIWCNQNNKSFHFLVEKIFQSIWIFPGNHKKTRHINL